MFMLFNCFDYIVASPNLNWLNFVMKFKGCSKYKPVINPILRSKMIPVRCEKFSNHY